MEVYVFKTSVTKKQFKKVAMLLDKEEYISSWNLDFEDCDNILRVVSDENISNFVSELLKREKFYCEKLL